MEGYAARLTGGLTDVDERLEQEFEARLGHAVREVAALLNVAEGTVKSRLFDARKKLREQLSWMQSGETR